MENAFLNFLGDTPNTRLLEFLISGREFDYTLTDLTENAKISWSTLHRIFPRFENQKIVTKTREVGRAKLYKLNKNNKEVKLLISIYNSLLKKKLIGTETKQKTKQTIGYTKINKNIVVKESK